ncbi:MAG: DUF4221 family protein [Niastella sp.]|nr:DUF4221 family protein [Niastella sp.]
MAGSIGGVVTDKTQTYPMRFHNCKSYIIGFLLFTLLTQSCRNSVQTIAHSYHNAAPIYDSIQLAAQPDTLQFLLRDNTYNEVKSFNIFQGKGIYYISFYDQRSQSISIYYLLNQQPYLQIPLKKLFRDNQLHKTSVFIKNWDSIFVINKSTLRLFDSSGHRKVKIEFPAEPEGNAAVFDSHKQPVLIGHTLYAISRNRVDYRSLNALRNWKVIYSFDLEKSTTQLLYPLPRQYQESLYGDCLLEYNFCYNHLGKFVFSFPADTLLYETNLVDYFHSYFARSREQQTPIAPVPAPSLKKYEDELKEYAIRDSYGPVLFDPANKYYLRLVRHKISPEDFQAKKSQQQTVLIFNEHFQIIGESAWPASVDFESLFFTPDGRLYARTNFQNEYALQFVRFTYHDNKGQPASLSGMHTPQK